MKLPLDSYKKLPQSVVHGDMKVGNVKWHADGNDIYTLLDWERVRQEQARIEEFKNALSAAGRNQARSYNRENLSALLKGYQKEAVQKLTEEELDALPYIIGHGAFLWDLARWLIRPKMQNANEGDRARIIADSLANFQALINDFDSKWWRQQKDWLLGRSDEVDSKKRSESRPTAEKEAMEEIGLALNPEKLRLIGPAGRPGSDKDPAAIFNKLAKRDHRILQAVDFLVSSPPEIGIIAFGTLGGFLGFFLGGYSGAVLGGVVGGFLGISLGPLFFLWLDLPGAVEKSRIKKRISRDPVFKAIIEKSPDIRLHEADLLIDDARKALKDHGDFDVAYHPEVTGERTIKEYEDPVSSLWDREHIETYTIESAYYKIVPKHGVRSEARLPPAVSETAVRAFKELALVNEALPQGWDAARDAIVIGGNPIANSPAYVASALEELKAFGYSGYTMITGYGLDAAQEAAGALPEWQKIRDQLPAALSQNIVALNDFQGEQDRSMNSGENVRVITRILQLAKKTPKYMIVIQAPVGLRGTRGIYRFQWNQAVGELKQPAPQLLAEQPEKMFYTYARPSEVSNVARLLSEGLSERTNGVLRFNDDPDASLGVLNDISKQLGNFTNPNWIGKFFAPWIETLPPAEAQAILGAKSVLEGFLAAYRSEVRPQQPGSRSEMRVYETAAIPQAPAIDTSSLTAKIGAAIRVAANTVSPLLSNSPVYASEIAPQVFAGTSHYQKAQTVPAAFAAKWPALNQILSRFAAASTARMVIDQRQGIPDAASVLPLVSFARYNPKAAVVLALIAGVPEVAAFEKELARLSQEGALPQNFKIEAFADEGEFVAEFNEFYNNSVPFGRPVALVTDRERSIVTAKIGSRRNLLSVVGGQNPLKQTASALLAADKLLDESIWSMGYHFVSIDKLGGLEALMAELTGFVAAQARMAASA